MTTSVSVRSPGTLNPTRQQLDELDALLQRMLELPVNKLEDAEQEAAEEPPSAVGDPPSAIDSSPGDGGQPTADSGQRTAVSYMVVETASPRPLPPASGFEPRPSPLKARLAPLTPPKVETREAPIPQEQKSEETPVPHDETPGPKSDEGAWVPLRSTWQPSAQTWQPLAESWHQAHNGQPLPNSRPSPPVGGASRASAEDRPSAPDLSPPTTDTASVNPAAAVAESPLSLSPQDAPATVPALLLPLLWFNQGFDACLAPLGPLGRWVCGSGGRQMLGFVGLTCLAAAVAIAVSAGMGWTW